MVSPLFITAQAPEASYHKKVYLTFDADMTPFMKRELSSGKIHSWYSPELVSYLEENNIPATIFTTGMFAEVYPDVIKKLAETPGIVIANHTYDHPGFEAPCYKLKIISSDQEKKNEILKTQEIIKSLVGYEPRYFRYPGLCHNEHDDLLVKELGLQISVEGIISGDAFTHDAIKIEEHILENVHDGSVIIMHLGGPHAPATDVVVRDIVSKLEKENYVFQSL